MRTQRAFLRALVLAALLTTVISVGVALAETRSQSGVTGSTWHDGGTHEYKGRTTSGSPAPYLYVNIRAWAGSPNPLKDEKTSDGSNTTATGIVAVADLYMGGRYISRHLANTQYGGVEFYTSATGCQSNFCWWNTGATSCASSC